MKILFTSILCLILMNGTAQDSTNLKYIDSLVTIINTSNFKVEKDSVFTNSPEDGLSIKTYLTMLSENNQLKNI